MESYKGKLLIARPNIQTPFFKHSVIYIYEDVPEGTQGIMLNKPTPFPVNNIFKHAGLDYGNESILVHKGGPLAPHSISLLHTNEWQSSNTLTGPRFSVSSDEFMIEKMATGNEPQSWRIVGGLCGWAPGQLQHEIDVQESWLVTDPTERLLFDYDGNTQWEKAVEVCSKNTIAKFF